MNIAELSIKKKVITWTLTAVVLYIGYNAYNGLPRLEDPEFAIKDAVVITHYPGASAVEVEKEVTEQIEKAAQELGQLKRVESYSSRGVSVVKVKIKDNYDKTMLPQVWDELRRKVNDYQAELPPGAGPSIVNDDFGDVYGVYLALTGDGYSMAELKIVGELLKRELTVVQDVKKVVFQGLQQEVVYVEMSRTKMANLGITRQEIFDALQAKNLVADGGKIKIGTEFMAVVPTGVFDSEKDFGDLLISSKGGRLVYLKDVATVMRGYQEPPKNILRVDGQPSLGIAISTVIGGNAVVMGEALDKRIRELVPQIPVGVNLEVISLQSDTVTKAINGFVINLLEAVGIVVVVLLIFMGVKSGLIIGFILLLTIAATFALMGYYQITLERISLGALIIALGMLVDNAIVVVDGMKVKIEKGMDGIQAAKEVVGQNATPLFGATAVAVLAFASIGGMDNQTGEYCRSLYYVILISLSLSWLTAITTTPLVTYQLMKPKKDAGKGEAKDPYGGKFYQLYKKGLESAIRFRWVTLGVVAGMFVAAMIGFGYLDNMFFPSSTAPQFLIECQWRSGNHIRETEKGVARMEDYLLNVEGVTQVASSIGSGHPRFLLTYSAPQDVDTHYAALLVSVDDYKIIDEVGRNALADLEEMFPDVTVNVKRLNLGPGEGGKIQLRINGPDRRVLRQLADRAMGIMYEDGNAQAIRTEWGEEVKVIRPVLREDVARRLGIDRPQVADAIESNFQGMRAGLYREDIDLIPIVTRAPEIERMSMEDLRAIQIHSPVAQQSVPMSQVVSSLETVTENVRVTRYHRRPMIKIHCDARTGLNSTVFARIKPKIEQALGVDVGAYLGKDYGPDEDPFAKYTATTIPVKYDDVIPLKDMPGYFIAWSGEAEDSADAIKKLSASIPIYFGMMILVVIFLFNAFRQPLVIWLTVPLALIGVTAGLAIFKQPFGFMALLGLMSLSGMLIKNAIVLIDQIDTNIKSGMDRYESVIDSGVSRMRPVSMAALTTIMGMIPLLQDAFFISMAVTIMFGLGFATVLTLVVVPTLYATFFKIPAPKEAQANE
jgi:multidrug efflux pump subunit AcrB